MAGDYGIDIVNRSNELKVKKRNKKLAVVTLVIIVLAVLTVAVMVFIKWFQNDDRVVIEAITKTFSNEGIFNDEGGNVKGYYKVEKESGAESYVVNFDVAETPKQIQGIFDLQMNQNAKMKITESYRQDGSLYIKGDDITSFVRRMGGDKVADCIEGGDCESEEELVEEETDEESKEKRREDASDDDGLLDVVRYGQIMAGLMEGKWYKINVDEVVSAGNTCITDGVERLSTDLTRGLISKYYNESPFLEVNKQLEKSNDEMLVFEVKINKDNLVEFLNKLDKVRSTVELYDCFDGQQEELKVSDLAMRDDWRAELTISRWKHYVEKVKFYGTLEDNEKVELEANLSRKAALGIQEPNEAADAETLRKDIEEGSRGGMRLMYQEMASKECAKNTTSHETLNACKEQVMKQAEKTLQEYKFEFPLKIEL